MNLLRPATLSFALTSALSSSNKPGTLAFHPNPIVKRSAATHTVGVLSQHIARHSPKAIPAHGPVALRAGDDAGIELAVDEMCQLLVPCALAQQPRNLDELETLGEYFGGLLNNQITSDPKTEQSDPFAGLTQLVQNLMHTLNTLGANHQSEEKGIISKIDDRTLSYLNTLFTECLGLQKRGLSAELKPLITQLELEQNKRLEQGQLRQAPPTQTFG